MPSARPVISHPARPPRHHTPAITQKVSKRCSLYDCSSSSDESSRPALKRVSCCTAGITSGNSEMKMRAPISTMDAIGFDNLPPAVRRKVSLEYVDSSIPALTFLRLYQMEDGLTPDLTLTIDLYSTFHRSRDFDTPSNSIAAPHYHLLVMVGV